MAKKAAANSDAIYQIKVTIEGSKPPIWRRLLVPANLNLGDLHQILQVAMGWTDSHLHQFLVGEKTYGTPDPNMDWTLDEDRVKLAQIVTGEKFKFRYEYDFGDSWLHAILVEKILPAEPGKPYPICVKGKGNCPPEDCGGIWGFYDFVEAMANPKHPEHKNLKEWYGGDFDPEAFDIDEVNRILTGGGVSRPKKAMEATVLACRLRAESSGNRPKRRLRIGPARGRGEVELEPLLPGEPDEVPVVDEPSAVDVAQLVEHDPSRGPEASRAVLSSSTSSWEVESGKDKARSTSRARACGDSGRSQGRGCRRGEPRAARLARYSGRESHQEIPHPDNFADQHS